MNSNLTTAVMFPPAVKCPECGLRLRPRKPMRFRCPKCSTAITLDAGGAHHTHCISIGSPRNLFGASGPDSLLPRIFRQRFQSILRLSFYDVEEKRNLRTRQFPKPISQRSDVRRAIRFSKNCRRYLRTHPE